MHPNIKVGQDCAQEFIQLNPTFLSAGKQHIITALTTVIREVKESAEYKRENPKPEGYHFTIFGKTFHFLEEASVSRATEFLRKINSETVTMQTVIKEMNDFFNFSDSNDNNYWENWGIKAQFLNKLFPTFAAKIGIMAIASSDEKRENPYQMDIRAESVTMMGWIGFNSVLTAHVNAQSQLQPSVHTGDPDPRFPGPGFQLGKNAKR